MGEKEVKSEIERYIVVPGQACAYKIGMLKIQELRARAEKELGDKFDQREFHDIVLKNGALPLEILQEQINEYIQNKKDLATNADPLTRILYLARGKAPLLRPHWSAQNRHELNSVVPEGKPR
jgi:hypothetical protein